MRNWLQKMVWIKSIVRRGVNLTRKQLSHLFDHFSLLFFLIVIHQFLLFDFLFRVILANSFLGNRFSRSGGAMHENKHGLKRFLVVFIVADGRAVNLLSQLPTQCPWVLVVNRLLWRLPLAEKLPPGVDDTVLLEISIVFCLGVVDYSYWVKHSGLRCSAWRCEQRSLCRPKRDF